MISKVVVVSLRDAEERRKTFSARSVTDIPWRFFDAHTSLADGLIYDAEEAEQINGRRLFPGEIGCYSSHVAVWRQLLQDDVEQYIVMEDDVVMDWNALRVFYENPISKGGHHYIRLFQKHPSRFHIVEYNFLKRGQFLVDLMDMAYGTQAYVIDKEAARIFLASCERVLRPIDDQMDRYWEHGVSNLAVFPTFSFEQSVHSTIAEGTSRARGKPRSWRRRLFLLKDRNHRRLVILKSRLGRLTKRR